MSETNPAPPLTPANLSGFKLEHILLSVTVLHGGGSCGQVDDSCSTILKRELNQYHGVKGVHAEVLYKHTHFEQHAEGCECHYCHAPEIPAGA